MTERASPRIIQVQSDAGLSLRVIEIPSAPRYELADGRSVEALSDGLFRIVATGEILTPR